MSNGKRMTAEQIAREMWEERGRWSDFDDCGEPDERTFIREVTIILERRGVPA